MDIPSLSYMDIPSSPYMDLRSSSTWGLAWECHVGANFCFSATAAAATATELAGLGLGAGAVRLAAVVDPGVPAATRALARLAAGEGFCCAVLFRSVLLLLEVSCSPYEILGVVVRDIAFREVGDMGERGVGGVFLPGRGLVEEELEGFSLLVEEAVKVVEEEEEEEEGGFRAESVASLILETICAPVEACPAPSPR